MIDIRLPDDLAGKTVLDVGGYDGGMAARCLERGAVSATVVDNGEWRRYGWGPPTPQPGVVYQDGDLFGWAVPADLVICSNVIYHVRDPFAALEKLRWLVRWKLLVRTSFVTDAPPSGWRFYPEGSGHPNGTVWCRPTPEGLLRALGDAGFRDAVEQGREGDHVVVEAS